MKKVSRVLTLSKYDWGTHSTNKNALGTVSFLQSMVPIGELLNELVYEKGALIGDSVTVTMEVKSYKNKKRAKK